MLIKSLIVYDDGDPSVGIQGGYWEIKFNRGYGVEVDDDELENFRAEVKRLYVWDGGEENGTVEFDFETEKRLAGERAENEEMDRLSDLAEKTKRFEQMFQFIE